MKLKVCTSMALLFAALCVTARPERHRPSPQPVFALPLRSIGEHRPSQDELPPNTWALLRNSNGDIKLWCNDAGIMIAGNPLLEE